MPPFLFASVPGGPPGSRFGKPFLLPPLRPSGCQAAVQPRLAPHLSGSSHAPASHPDVGGTSKAPQGYHFPLGGAVPKAPPYSQNNGKW